jgi:uridine kinase
MKENMKYSILLITLLSSVLIMDVAQAQMLVGIAGGTGSGKTTLANQIVSYFDKDAALIQQDSYYKDLSNFPLEEREKMNFDHPDSLDFALLKQHLQDLKNNKPISKPIYDFVTHSQCDHAEVVFPRKVIVVEGILILSDPSIRELLDLKLYVETDDDIRILRRLERDIHERGRHFESVKKQYITTVKPMHKQYVKPSKEFADIIIYGINENLSVITKLISGYLENSVVE